MGWIAVTKENELLREEDNIGRPMELGNNGGLKCIAQEDFGHSVAVDLINGVIAIDYDSPLTIQNDTVELANVKTFLWIADDVNIVGEYRHLSQQFFFAKNDKGTRYLRDGEGKKIRLRNDVLTPLTWRPIWFTRWTNGIPVKIIGAQTTTPEMQGATNVKKMVSLYPDGRLGID